MAASPPDLDSFYALVWEIVRQVPYGRVATYGQIAAMISPPAEVEEEAYRKLAPRWVGSAMNAILEEDNPTIPWHRVINSKGMVSLSPDSRAGVLQRQRLESEGIVFDQRGKVDFRQFGWTEIDPAWLAEKGLRQPLPHVSDPPAERDVARQLPLF